MAVLVIGGGPAGCAAAHTLAKRGHQVTLLEAEGRLGGRTWTLREDGFRIDTGAGFICNFYPRTLALVRELGRASALVEMTRVNGFHDGRVLHAIPHGSMRGYARLPLLGWGDKARVAVRLARSALGPAPDLFDLDALAEADRGESIAQWARRAVGEAAYHAVIRPGVEPYWYFRCEEAAAPLVIGLLKVARSARFLCLADGMGSLCEWLAAGVEVRLGLRALHVELAGDRVRVLAEDGEAFDAEGAVLATDAHAAAGLLGFSPAAERLEGVPYAANVHVALAYDHDPWAGFPASLVFCVGPGEHRVATVGLLARKSRSLVPLGGQVVSVCFTDRASRRLSAQQAERAAREAIAHLLGSPAPEPRFVRVFRRELAIPVPRPGQYAALRGVRDGMPSRLRLAGDYLSHATIEGAVRSGERAAHELHAALGGNRPQLLAR
jgi:oxygen-dependent protoporphyrinogen oxidase